MAVLVTGGAGYIGSIVVDQLIDRGEDVVVFDNLQSGHREALHPAAVFVHGDLADVRQLEALFEKFAFDAIMHFASNTLPHRSMQQPFPYIGDDITNTTNLLREATRHRVQRFVLASTANLFGHPRKFPIPEDDWILPSSPCGESKYLIERILYWIDRVYRMRYACLRSFNAAGALPNGKRGEDHRPETHLIPRVLSVALGQSERVDVYGTDHATPDGTCIRDYVHVLDLAEAHLLALRACKTGSRIYNVGSGRGFSVQEVIETARQVTGCRIPIVEGPCRPGDPAVLIADSSRIRQDLGWRPRHSTLQEIVETAWNWHRAHPKGYCQPSP